MDWNLNYDYIFKLDYRFEFGLRLGLGFELMVKDLMVMGHVLGKGKDMKKITIIRNTKNQKEIVVIIIINKLLILKILSNNT